MRVTYGVISLNPTTKSSPHGKTTEVDTKRVKAGHRRAIELVSDSSRIQAPLKSSSDSQLPRPLIWAFLKHSGHIPWLNWALVWLVRYSSNCSQ